MAVNPGKATAHYNLGNALSPAWGYLKTQSPATARAIKLKPQYAAAHFDLGNVLYDLYSLGRCGGNGFSQALDGGSRVIRIQMQPLIWLDPCTVRDG